MNVRSSNNDVRVPAFLVRDVARRLLLASGADPWVAEATADGLWHASLRGTDSHGIRLLPHYLLGLKKGRINPRPDVSFRRTAPSTGKLDAHHTFGHAAGVKAMDAAIALASETGIGFVAVSNSSHCGAMSYFGIRACEHDMIGLAFTHASPKLMTPGSTKSFFGTNPICVCAPMAGEGPFSFDSAPTSLTSNRLLMLAEAGLPIPPGLAADSSGQLTTDAKNANQLLPIGGYKGFGLTMVVDVFCALLTGMPAGPKVSMMYLDPMDERRLLGQFYGAVRIDAFEDPQVFKSRLKELCDGVRSQPRRASNEEPPMAPGDPEKRAEADRLANGIPLPAHLITELNALAVRLGVVPLSESLGECSS
jgi:LDH2 family malate/lactate/ureidoglycolate dehydrogenase